MKKWLTFGLVFALVSNLALPVLGAVYPSEEALFVSYYRLRQKKQIEAIDGLSLLTSKEKTSMKRSDNGENVKICVIDSGIDFRHTELQHFKTLYDKLAGEGKEVNYFNAFESSANANKLLEDPDKTGHGTRVSSILAAATDNQFGMVSLGHQADLYFAQSIDDGGSASDYYIEKGLEWAVRNNVDVINMSMSNPNEIKGLDVLIKKAIDQGIIVVAAAGNEAENLHDINKPKTTPNYLSYPAAYDGVIGVGSVDETFAKRADFSHHNKTVDVVAPGKNVYCAMTLYESALYYRSRDPRFTSTEQGTSLSAPMVSAVAGLCKARWPQMNAKDFLEILEETSKPLGGQTKGQRTDDYGYGLLQAAKAVKLAEEKAAKMPSVPEDTTDTPVENIDSNENDNAPNEGGNAPTEGDGSSTEGDGSPAEGDGSPAEGDGSSVEGEDENPPVDSAPVIVSDKIKKITIQKEAAATKLQVETSETIPGMKILLAQYDENGALVKVKDYSANQEHRVSSPHENLKLYVLDESAQYSLLGYAVAPPTIP